MSQSMKQIVPGLLISLLAIALVPRLGLFTGLFDVVAIIGWALILIGVLHRCGAMPEPLASLLDRVAPSRRIDDIKAEQREARRRALIEGVDAGRLVAHLDEVLIGQESTNIEIGRAIEIFVAKKNPSKPLSILIAGPAGSGRSTFAEGLSAALSEAGGGHLVRIDCANDSDIDLASVSARIQGLPLPILLLDNVERIADQKHSSQTIADLARLLDGGGLDGKSPVSHGILLLTTLCDEGMAASLHSAKGGEAGDLALRMRLAVRGSGRLPDDIVNRIDQVAVLKPLEALEQVAVVWKTFCAIARREHEIEIVEEGSSLGDGIEDFLIEARERWVKAGVSGVREAARFVSGAADEAFLAASRAGHARVFARWDASRARIALLPVPDDMHGSTVAAASLEAHGEVPTSQHVAANAHVDGPTIEAVIADNAKEAGR